MCAIAGQISFTKPINAKTTNLLLDTMIHRGPDDRGIFLSKKVVFGMNRLSIIDVAGGQQPLYSNSKKQVIVGNGEIYNYKTLKKKLKAPHTYKTGSDIEVALHAFLAYPNSWAEHIQGMFALAIYDEDKQRVVLARDRLGEKPLYYARVGSSVYFASELKAMVRIPGISKKLEYQQLHSYFFFQYIPEAKTPFVAIKKLKPGHTLTIDLRTQTLVETPYWDLLDLKKADAKNSTKSVRENIEEAVSMASIADVEVGVSLSGGIDSATILSLYAKQKKGKITAVTVGYEGESKYDEGVLASQIAKAQNCTHHIKKMLTSDVVKNFPKVVYYADEPIADLASSAIFEVSKEARSKGLKVLLSGLGGDELYWGYPWVRKQTQKNYASNGKRFHLFDTTKAWKIAKHILSFGFASQFRNAIDNKYLSVLLQPSKQKIAKEQTVRTSMIEVKDRWLIPNCVELNDRLSMANSVEMRSPLLSATLFEQAYSSKAILKGFALAHKATLKKAVADLFDKAFLEKGKKGFTPPVAKWLSAIIEAYKHLLIGGFLEKEKIFSPFFLKVVVRTGKIMAPLWHTIYMLLVLEIWGRMYVLGEEVESIKCYNKQHD